MAQKDDQKFAFFLSQSSKQIPKLERRLEAITNQMKTMIDLSSMEILDGTTLLRVSNDCMKDLIKVDEDLRKVMNQAQSNIRKLSREQRAKASVDFRGQIKRLEKKFLAKAVQTANQLRKVAMDKAKDQRVSNTSGDPFIVVLRVIQALVVMVKFFQQQNKKIK